MPSMDAGGPEVTRRVGDTDRHGGGGRRRAVYEVSALVFPASLSPASVLTLICSVAQETAGSSSGSSVSRNRQVGLLGPRCCALLLPASRSSGVAPSGGTRSVRGAATETWERVQALWDLPQPSSPGPQEGLPGQTLALREGSLRHCPQNVTAPPGP